MNFHHHPINLIYCLAHYHHSTASSSHSPVLLRTVIVLTWCLPVTSSLSPLCSLPPHLHHLFTHSTLFIIITIFIIITTPTCIAFSVCWSIAICILLHILLCSCLSCVHVCSTHLWYIYRPIICDNITLVQSWPSDYPSDTIASPIIVESTTGVSSIVKSPVFAVWIPKETHLPDT